MSSRCSGEGNPPRSASATDPPLSRLDTREDSWSTSCDFHGPQAVGPVARPSASDSARSSARCSAVPTTSATIVDGGRVVQVPAGGHVAQQQVVPDEERDRRRRRRRRSPSARRWRPRAPHRPRCGRRDGPCRCRAGAPPRPTGRVVVCGVRSRPPRRCTRAGDGRRCSGGTRCAAAGCASVPTRGCSGHQRPYWSSASTTGIDAGPCSTRSTKRRRASSGHGTGIAGAPSSAASVARLTLLPVRAAPSPTRSTATRIGHRRGFVLQAHPSVADHQPVVERSFLAETLPEATAGPQVGLVPALVARPCDRATCGGDASHEDVGVVVAESGSDRVLLGEQQPVARTGSDAMQLDPHLEQRVVVPLQLPQQLRVDLGARRRGPRSGRGRRAARPDRPSGRAPGRRRPRRPPRGGS